jgi:hypothetical protein
MHTYILTRGIKQHIDDWITRLQGLYLDFPIKKKGTFGAAKPGLHKLQVRVNPIQLWEICYPREQKDAMLTTLFGKDNAGKPMHSKHQMGIAMLRKMLKVDKIPEYNGSKMFPTGQPLHTEVIGIGQKEDEELPCGTEGI